jgi:hypothetical protein
MATKSDFTSQEWETLRDAPHYVALAVATAGASGPFGSIKEAFAPAAAIVEAAKGSNDLLRSICDRAELKAAQQAVKGSITAQDIKDMKSLRTELQKLAEDKARAASTILQEKSTGQDGDTYRSFLVKIAEKTANAAKEGGFLGFGGEWVSKDEKAVLSRITEAVEV